VICISGAGKGIGVEIAQWTHEGEMKEGALRDQHNQHLLDALRPQPINTSEHFWLVVFYPKAKLQIGSKSEAFRGAMLKLIEEVDRTWHHGRQRYAVWALEPFNPLNEYLERVIFLPHNESLDAAVSEAIDTCNKRSSRNIPWELESDALEGSGDWIVPAVIAQPAPTGYEPEKWGKDKEGRLTMEGSLLNTLRKKAARCNKSSLKTDCSEVHLLIAFDHAMSHSFPTPFKTRTAERAVGLARNDARCWPFQSAFLLIADEDNPIVHGPL
jgi:hypothetical protein